VKVGDLVKWEPDDDVGIVVGIVGDLDEDGEWDVEAGNPQIAWFGLSSYASGAGPRSPIGVVDSSVKYHDENLSIISESR
jgi:hypothetical protein